MTSGWEFHFPASTTHLMAASWYELTTTVDSAPVYNLTYLPGYLKNKELSVLTALSVVLG